MKEYLLKLSEKTNNTFLKRILKFLSLNIMFIIISIGAYLLSLVFNYLIIGLLR